MTPQNRPRALPDHLTPVKMPWPLLLLSALRAGGSVNIEPQRCHRYVSGCHLYRRSELNWSHPFEVRVLSLAPDSNT